MSKNSNKQQAKSAPAPAVVETAKATESVTTQDQFLEQAAIDTAAIASEAMNEVVALDQAKAAEGEEQPVQEELPPAGDESKESEVKATETPNSAPVATAQGTKEIKVGAVVDPKQAKLGKEAPEALKQSISEQSTSKPVDNSSPFEQKLAKIIAGDNGRLRDIALQMQAYVKNMSPGVPMTAEEGARHQQTLFRIMKNVVEQDDSFKEAFRLVVSFYKEYKNGVFSAAYIHRFHADLTMSPSDTTALTRLVNLFTTAAGVTNKADVNRLVNLNATFNVGLSDSARDRVVQYFNT